MLAVYLYRADYPKPLMQTLGWFDSSIRFMCFDFRKKAHRNQHKEGSTLCKV